MKDFEGMMKSVLERIKDLGFNSEDGRFLVELLEKNVSRIAFISDIDFLKSTIFETQSLGVILTFNKSVIGNCGLVVQPAEDFLQLLTDFFEQTDKMLYIHFVIKDRELEKYFKTACIDGPSCLDGPHIKKECSIKQ
ncbi:MAG: hypothetical protein GX755_00070 [Syntrophomonadaceae bacterium]|nr:hypothetical protein [Syntrophomonadaceae bacterium]